MDIFGEEPSVFHARACSSGHVNPNWLVHCGRLSMSDCWGLACSFSDCWRRSGTTPGAMHTAMPRTIVVLSSVYIITTSSHEYKDGVVGILKEKSRQLLIPSLVCSLLETINFM